MKSFTHIFKLGTLCGLIFMVGCSDNSSSNNDFASIGDVKGVVEKGPFVKGTDVSLYELNPETYAQTGKIFTGSIVDNDGTFLIANVELSSPYVIVDATGYYWNELYGMKSSKTLNLKAAAHIEEGNKINVNIGTHLTYKRILELVEEGLSFDKAKARAESELMDAFFNEASTEGLEKTSIFDNEKLLALSLIVLSAGVESDVTDAIAAISEDFSGKALLTTLADRSAMRYEDFARARKFMKDQFPNTEIGNFEKYVYLFWERIYGLETCSESKENALDTVFAEKSLNDGRITICKLVDGEFRWEFASDLEITTANIVAVEAGELIKSLLDSSKAFVYDGKVWRDADSIEIVVGKGCVETTKEQIVATDIGDYVCKELNSTLLWRPSNIRDYPKETYFNKDVEYGSVTDERDGRSYRTVEIAGMTWMAENLSYAIDGADCEDSLTIGCAYDWHSALVIAKTDTLVPGEQNRGVCMENWHVPDSTEWNKVINSVSLGNLKSSIGWSDGTNKSGFSVVPLAYAAGAGIAFAYNDVAYADFIVANYGVSSGLMGSTGTFGYAMSFDTDLAKVVMMSQQKGKNRYLKASLRCVKDSE